MDTEQPQPKVELEVKNFGPIAEAKIDLRPLTVFVGPSNTGKTYLATLIYALHNVLSKADNVHSLSFASAIGAKWRPRSEELTSSEEEAISAWIERLAHSGSRDNEDESVDKEVPDDVTSMAMRLISETTFRSDLIETELIRCFGVADPQGLIREGSGESAAVGVAVWQAGDGNDQPVIEWTSSIGIGERQCSFELRKEPGLRIGDAQVDRTIGRIFGIETEPDYSPFEAEDNEDRSRLLGWFAADVAKVLSSQALGSFHVRAHDLPADRAGIMHAHRSIVGAIVRSAPRVAIEPMAEVPPVSGVVADFLENLVLIDDVSRRSQMRRRAWQREHPLANELEGAILSGTIVQDRTASSYPVYYYRPFGWDRNVALMNASSMITELAPVVLYLRNVIGPGETLIIEEPESHLHPEMQAEFAVMLARLVKSGVRVLLTTHSEWMLDQFANLVRLNDLPEEARGEFDNCDAALSADDFGAWLFKTQDFQGGSVVEEIRVDPDADGLPSGYSDIAIELYNTWASIGNRAIDLAADA